MTIFTERQRSQYGGRWQIAPELASQLLGPDGLRLAEWLAAGQAQIVKQGPQRTIYRVVLPGIDVHIKHFRLPDARTWLREAIRPSKARLEYERALAVAATGLPTVTPLALGETPGLAPGESFLVTRTVADAEPLGAFLERLLPTYERRRAARLRQHIAHALANLLAQMHGTGVRHDDLHANNLLLRLDADDEPTLFLVDLHATRVGSPLGWPAARAQLVLVNRWFVLRANRSDRLRFWKTYARASGFDSTERIREVEERTWISNGRFWTQRDARSLATNRYYRRVRSSAAIGHVVADFDASALLADPDEPFRRADAVILKDSPSSTVIETTVVVDGVARPAIYKRFRTTTRDPWLSLVRRTAALRSWQFGHGLRERLLPTPRPLAVLHRRRFGLLFEGYLLCEKVVDAVDLGCHIAGIASPLALRSLIADVARLVRDLHRRHLSHRDLKAPNILVQPSLEGTAALWLIDLVGVSRHRRLSETRRVQNLARLNASFLGQGNLTRSDKVRFLRTYLEWGLRGKGGWKRWWRQIAAATQAKVARNARRGRPLS